MISKMQMMGKKELKRVYPLAVSHIKKKIEDTSKVRNERKVITNSQAPSLTPSLTLALSIDRHYVKISEY